MIKGCLLKVSPITTNNLQDQSKGSNNCLNMVDGEALRILISF